MSVLKLKCIDQVLTTVNTPVIASGGVEETTLEVEFCEKWDGYGKTASFYHSSNKNKIYLRVLDVNNQCKIPAAVVATKGKLHIAIGGVKDTVTRTSNYIKYPIVEGACLEGVVPEEPEADVYSQLMTNYGEAMTQGEEINEKYKAIFDNLAETVANMPAAGFVNLNGNNAIVRFWHGTQAEYDALEVTEEGVHYIIYDKELVATRAYSDEEGNNIKETYATKTEVEVKAGDYITKSVFESFIEGLNTTITKAIRVEGLTGDITSTSADGVIYYSCEGTVKILSKASSKALISFSISTNSSVQSLGIINEVSYDSSTGTFTFKIKSITSSARVSAIITYEITPWQAYQQAYQEEV